MGRRYPRSSYLVTEMTPGRLTLLLFGLLVSIDASLAQSNKGGPGGDGSTLAPVLIVASKKNLGGDPDVNLPPSHDDKKTVAGTVQGVVKLDGSYEEGLDSVIQTNRTTAFLNCTSGSMNVDVEFKEPFYGRIYADFNRLSPCSVNGNGGTKYTVVLPLRGCGTIQDPARVFINNIIVRFHAGLELDGDEVKTIICRYPPPVAPPPAVPNIPIIATEPPPLPPVAQSLGELEILLILCAILFLALVLLGMGFSYYCLKRRHIRVIRKAVSSPGSEVTKASDATWGALSMFDGLRIPRAHATSMSGSEVNLVTDQEQVSDTLPSDYPSESPSSLHSEVEDVDTRSLRRPSSVDSQSVHLSSVYSDAHFNIDQELVTNPTLTRPPKLEFDVAVRIKKAPAPKPPTAAEKLEQVERSLSKILEEDDDDDEPEPPIIELPRVTTTPLKAPRTKSLSSLNTEQTEARSVSEVLEATPRMEMMHASASMEVAVPPQKSTHVVDDRYLNTITETDVIEDVTRHTREITEYMRRPKPAPPDWDVVIRNYAVPKSGPPTARTLSDDAMSSTTMQSDWDEVRSRMSGPALSEAPIKPRYTTTANAMLDSSIDEEESHRRVTTRVDVHTSEHHLTEMEVPVGQRPPPNWDVLIRVLSPPPEEAREIDDALTDDDKETWRRIITTESTLRELLTEATVKEDFEKIKKDQRYMKLFEPKKWDVIIRVLSKPPEDNQSDRRSEMSDSTFRTADTVSTRGNDRRSNGSDNGSSGSSGNKKRGKRRSPPSSTSAYHQYAAASEYTERDRHLLMMSKVPRSRRTSKSSGVIDNDMRSMTEEFVTDYARPEMDSYSEASGHTSRYPRSMAERSTSEYTDRPQMIDYDDGRSVVSSRRISHAGSHRSLERGMSEFAEDWTAVMRESDLESAYSRRTSAASNMFIPSGLIIEEEEHQEASGGAVSSTSNRVEGSLEGLEQSIAATYQQRREVRSAAAYSNVSNWMAERRT